MPNSLFKSQIIILLMISFLFLSSSVFAQTADDEWRLMNEGAKLSQEAKYREALDRYEKGLKIAEELNDSMGICLFLGWIGGIHKILGNPALALQYHEKALKLSRETSDREEEGGALIDMGNDYFSQGDYKKAIEYFEEARKIKSDTKDSRGEATVLANMGAVYNKMGDNGKGREMLESALKTYEALGDKAGIGAALINLGVIYQSTGDFEHALKCYEKAYEVKHAIGEKLGEEMALANTGRLFEDLSDYEKALEYAQKALAISREIEDRYGEGISLANIGNVYSFFGDYKSALKTYQDMLKIMTDIKSKSGSAAAFTDMGNLFYQMRDYQQAMEFHRKALEILEGTGERAGEALELTNIGNVYLALDLFEQATDYNQKALEMRLEIGDLLGQSANLGNLGNACLWQYDYEGAKKYYQRALEIKEKIGDKKGVAGLCDNLGIIHNGENDSKAALASHQRALEIRKEIGDKAGEAISCANAGYTYALAGDFKNALLYSQEGLKIFTDLDDQEGIFRCHLYLGIVYDCMGQEEAAVQSLIRSINALESLRGRLKNDIYKTSFLYNRSYPYIKLMEILLRRKQYEEAWTYAERARARTFLDTLESQKMEPRSKAPESLLKQEEELRDNILLLSSQFSDKAQLESRRRLYSRMDAMKKQYDEVFEKIRNYDSEFASLKSPQAPSLEEIRKLLDDDTVILEYQVGQYEFSQKSCLFLIERKGLHAVEISENSRALTDRISDILKKIAAHMDVREESRSLSRVLLPDAAQDILKKKKRVIIIPNSVLHYLPFSLLIDEDGNYIIQSHEILIEPSAEVWRVCMEKQKSRKTQDKRIIAFAIGDQEVAFRKKAQGSEMAFLPSEISREDFSPLPSTLKEVESIAGIYPSAVIIRGNDMTSAKVIEGIKGKTCIHFATHGLLDPLHPLLSGLLLNDTVMTTADIFRLDLDADLVVLSACNTARGKQSAGDEFVGVSRAFIHAGTPSIIVTLWSVADDSTASLMGYFYKALSEGKTKAAALREAQLKLMKDYPQPFYWAPFILIGASEQE